MPTRRHRSYIPRGELLQLSHVDGADASALNGDRRWGWAAPLAVFSWQQKPMSVSIHAESTGVTGVLDVRPVLEGSGRDADPCQRQLLGPSVLANRRGQRLQPVFASSVASIALCRNRRRVIGSGGGAVITKGSQSHSLRRPLFLLVFYSVDKE